MSLTHTLTVFLGNDLIYIIVGLSILWFLLVIPRPFRKRVALFAAVSMPLTFLASLVAAHVYYDPRPFMVSKHAPLLAHASGNGFPSDHALLGAALAAWVFRYDQRLGSLLFGLTFVVGLTRVYAGVHHLVDILGSIAIAGLVAFLVYMGQKDINFRKRGI